MKFEQLNLIPELLKALREEGYEKPTPIQEKAIPVVLEQRDLLACAQTGTGKTAGFALPILQLLKKHPAPQQGRGKPIRALILTPTRELALQIDESFGAYGRHTGLSHTVIFGGVSQHAQTDRLKSGVDILTATPGRLLDLIQQKFINLSQIQLFVLDEADRMLDMGFIHDVKKVLTLLPSRRQNLLFSATMPEEIVKLAQSFLHNPARVEVTPVSSTADTVKQFVYYVERNQKKRLLIQLLRQGNIDTALVFTRTKHGANKLSRDLERADIFAAAIHGNKSQAARQAALGNFKSGKLQVLVATDIAARGIDIEELGYVINYELPNVPETYVHRIGRTGRAGASGTALSFCDSEEREYLRDIQKLIRKQIPVLEHDIVATADDNDTPPAKVHQQRHTHSRSQKPAPQSQGRQQNRSSKPGNNRNANPNRLDKNNYKGPVEDQPIVPVTENKPVAGEGTSGKSRQPWWKRKRKN